MQVSQRAPGEFAWQRFRERRRAWIRRVAWRLGLAAASEAALIVSLGAVLQPSHLELYVGFALGAGAVTLIALGDGPPPHIERWREGAEGEKATARALRALVRNGWTLTNDIDTGRGNIDHVLVGPAGVFVLDSTKLRGLISVHRGLLSVRWHEDPDDGYTATHLGERALAQARRVERALREHGCLIERVQSVVALWGEFDQRSILSGSVAGSEETRLPAYWRPDHRPCLRTRSLRSPAHYARRLGAAKGVTPGGAGVSRGPRRLGLGEGIRGRLRPGTGLRRIGRSGQARGPFLLAAVLVRSSRDAVFVRARMILYDRAMERGHRAIHEDSSSATISREVVRLLKSITGRGPTKARSHVLEDCVVVLLRDAHTVSEQSMAQAGLQRDVAQSRVDLSEDQRARFIAVVEQTTGRRVISFLTSSHQDPSILVQVYVLDAVLSLLEDEALTE